VSSYRACWVSPIPSLPRRFRRTEMVFRRHRPPASCEAGFILSCATLSFRVPSCSHLPACVSAASASLGVPSLFTTSARGVLYPANDPAFSGVPPAAFHTLSTVCSSPRLARLFHRAAMSRVLAPGVCSHDPAVSPRRRPFPSRRWRRCLPVSRRQQTSRRPQGVAPNRDPLCRRVF
jgi:hypothetical protein